MKIEALGITVKSSSNKTLYVYFPYIKFGEKDVVRNSLVSKIVSNYESFEKSEGIGYEYFSKASNND